MSLTPEQFKVRAAELMLPELKAGVLQWWFVSMANENGFQAGALVRALGPIDAMRVVHVLNLYVRGCETLTSGPIRQESVDVVPEEHRWVRLNELQSRLIGGNG